MDNNNFEKEMENLDTPEVKEIKHQQVLKITLVNSKKSSRLGIAFVVIPALFILTMVLKYELGIDVGVLNMVSEFFSSLDKIPYLKVLGPFILMGLPLLGVVLNLLAITHFEWNPGLKEFIITIKIRWMNIIIALASMLILAIFTLYLIVENAGHP